MSDTYEELRKASPEELLEAVELFYAINGEASGGFYRGLALGFKIASSNGWEQVAPAWLRELRGTPETSSEKKKML